MSYQDLDKVLGKGVRRISEESGGGSWPGMYLNPAGESLNNNREDLSKFYNEIIKNLDHRKGDILSIQFWAMVCVIIKA